MTRPDPLTSLTSLRLAESTLRDAEALTVDIHRVVMGYIRSIPGDTPRLFTVPVVVGLAATNLIVMAKMTEAEILNKASQANDHLLFPILSHHLNQVLKANGYNVRIAVLEEDEP